MKKSKILKAGYRLPDGLALQAERYVEFEERGDRKVIVGPADLRPAILLGSVLGG